MSGNWLYPLSGRSGRRFVLDDGTELDTSFESFHRYVRVPADPDEFYLGSCYRQVRPGDRLWFYYGVADGDRGIVGAGVVRRVEEREGDFMAVFNLERGRTRRLIADPFPAAEVRQHIQRPRTVTNLDRYPGLVRSLAVHAGVVPGG